MATRATDMPLDDLRERLVELNSEAHEIRTKAESEKRDLTAEEAEKLDACLSTFDRTTADIERLERLNRQTDLLTSGGGPRSQPGNPGANAVLDDEDDDKEPPARPASTAVALGPGRKTSPAPRAVAAMLRPKNGGFKSLGEFGHAVALAARSGAVADPRLQALASASTYANEGSGADGGFAVPQDFRTAIMEKVLGEDSLLARCDQITCQGNSFTFPVDETTPWGTTGIQAYWDGEAAAATQSKPVLQERTIKLNKIRALVPVTEELLDDASGMDAYLRKKAPEMIGFKVNLAIVQGDGVGKPLGILAAPCTVSVAKESGQQADTLVGNNVIKMYSRVYAPCRSRGVWLVSQDIEPQLYKLAVPGTDNTGNAVTGWGTMVYMPPGGLSQAPYGTIFGRPVVPTQACETLGDKGDIIFADLSQYLALLKSGPNPRVETSMHLWFDQDLMAFKFVLRVGGFPWWGSSVAARDGNNTYSCFVTLDDRA